MRQSFRNYPPPDNLTSEPSPVISLDQIRSGPRRNNEYVDSPHALATPPLKPHLPNTLIAGGVGGGGVNSPGFAHRVAHQPRGGSLGGGGGGGVPRQIFSPSTVVSQQPLSKSSPLKKDGLVSLDRNGGVNNRNAGEDTLQSDTRSMGTNHGGGIMCERCNKCQCASCTDPKPLPSHWCCGNKCEVSAEKTLNFCTCFCCVKCFFYHSGSEEDNECYENPCGCCSTPHCCRRWSVISLMAMCLPCLWTYWPARGCLAACTSCYNRCRRKGCQCHSKLDKDKSSVLSGIGVGGGGEGGGSGVVAEGGNSKHSQTRRLLIESDSSSA